MNISKQERDNYLEKVHAIEDSLKSFKKSLKEDPDLTSAALKSLWLDASERIISEIF